MHCLLTLEMPEMGWGWGWGERQENGKKKAESTLRGGYIILSYCKSHLKTTAFCLMLQRLQTHGGIAFIPLNSEAKGGNETVFSLGVG